MSGDLRAWWDDLCSKGPAYGYPVNASKTLLITKPEHLADAKAAFNRTHVNVTAEGRPYLGAPLGTKDYCDKFVADKVIEWKAELEMLSSIAETQGHAAYAVATHGLAGKWVYLARTTPNIVALLLPLKHVIQKKFLPALLGRAPPNTVQRDLLGGIDLAKRANDEFAASVLVTSPLKNLISGPNATYTSFCEVRHPQQEACATTGSC